MLHESQNWGKSFGNALAVLVHTGGAVSATCVSAHVAGENPEGKKRFNPDQDQLLRQRGEAGKMEFPLVASRPTPPSLCLSLSFFLSHCMHKNTHNLTQIYTGQDHLTDPVSFHTEDVCRVEIIHNKAHTMCLCYSYFFIEEFFQFQSTRFSDWPEC